MNLFAALFTVVAGIFLFRLPRRLAPLPLIIGSTYMTLGSSLEIGPFHFTVIRLLILIGAARVIVRRERINGKLTSVDKFVLWWSVATVISSVFHNSVSEALVFRLGLVYTALGLYFLLRIFLQTTEDIWQVAKLAVVALIPISLEMISESVNGRDYFSFLGGVPEYCDIRNGKLRAQGPFAHSILAGTVGAVCLPLAVLWWKRNRKLALVGMAATLSIVVCSQSSGPLMTTIFTIGAMFLWKFRRYMRLIRWSVVIGVLLLSLVMKAPVYYILDRIDLAGGSTGWHRAKLIDSAIHYIGDWWLGGTDYTANWTPEAGMTENDTDITNHYIRMAVWGGLPMMALFIGQIVAAFNRVGKAIKARWEYPNEEKYLIWTYGCALFGHVATMMSVSYFDQSVFFLYFALAVISSISIEPESETELEPAEVIAS
ncbi:MAG TPA: hypothetical protein VFT72_15945 [Opitutaceae bacterium]|nr:hypothetical protein [Opitutaceae bacterium]